MSLTKNSIIKDIYKNCGYSKKQSADHLESVLELIKKSLGSGEDVMISGFGKFYVKNNTTRIRKNQLPGNDLTPGAKRVVLFRCSPVLQAKVNGKNGGE